MIELRNLTKSYKTKFGRHYVYKNVNLILPDENIGLIGPNGAGKSTLLRLIGRIEYPDSGTIITDEKISFPVGFQGGFQGSLTGRELTRFVGSIYGLEGDKLSEMIEWVREFSELGKFFDLQIKTYSSGMRARLAFAISMAMDFDRYLLDEITAVGDINFRKKSSKELEKKIIKGKKIILASHSFDVIKKFCKIFIIPYAGNLEVFTNFNDALKFYEKILNNGNQFSD